MTSSADLWPLLVVTNGSMKGRSFSLSPGRSLIGRGGDAEIVVQGDGISKHHAVLDRRRTQVTIEDGGSRNGTWVNGRQVVSGPQVLEKGDLVEVGAVTLEFVPGARAAVRGRHGTSARGVRRGESFGDVHGPVQTGEGRQYVAGRDQFVAGGNIHHDRRTQVSADYDPWDELFQGRGIGRALMALGGCIALAGFGVWMYLIFSAMGTELGGPSPFERELFGLPMMVVGFGGFLGGGILAGIGGSLSKAARKRDERARHARDWE